MENRAYICWEGVGDGLAGRFAGSRPVKKVKKKTISGLYKLTICFSELISISSL